MTAEVATLQRQLATATTTNGDLQRQLARASSSTELLDKWTPLLRFVDPDAFSGHDADDGAMAILSALQQKEGTSTPPPRHPPSLLSSGSGTAVGSSNSSPVPPLRGIAVTGGPSASHHHGSGSAAGVGKKWAPRNSIDQLDGIFAALQAALSRVQVEQVRVAQYNSERSEQDQRHCAVCLDRDRNTALLPCGHVVLCTVCARSANMKTCPICRSEIAKVIEVYL